MELELHQLHLRYERLRKRHPLQERQLLASLAELGQQLPIIVIAESEAGKIARNLVEGCDLPYIAQTESERRSGTLACLQSVSTSA